MSESDSHSTESAVEIVKWYTRARRFPQLIGKTPDGATIWGGPYTYTQVIVGVGVLVLGSKTTWLWGHFGLIGNVLILFGGTYGLVLLLGRLPVGSRNPLSLAAGALRAFSAPTHGRVGGAPLRLPRPHVSRTRLVISPTFNDTSVRPPSRPIPCQIPHAARAASLAGGRPGFSPERHRPSTTRPATPAPQLTGVQRLLASAATPPREN